MAKTLAATVKVPPQTHVRLLKIAKEEDVSLGELVTDLLDRYETERFWQGVKEDYERLNSDPVATAQYSADLAEWDAFGNDVLDREEPYEADAVEARRDL